MKLIPPEICVRLIEVGGKDFYPSSCLLVDQWTNILLIFDRFLKLI
jgi:hypothetical protein